MVIGRIRIRIRFYEGEVSAIVRAPEQSGIRIAASIREQKIFLSGKSRTNYLT
jgi:hypothetical protein